MIQTHKFGLIKKSKIDKMQMKYEASTARAHYIHNNRNINVTREKNSNNKKVDPKAGRYITH